MNERVPYLQPGQLYQLTGMNKNKFEKCLATGFHAEDRLPYITNCSERGWPGPNARRYRDGDLFLCVRLDRIPETGYLQAYVLLAPDGKQVRVWHERNKGKFARVK